MRKFLAFFFVIALNIGTIFAQKDAQTLPAIQLKDMSGKSKDMSDYSKSGKITIISFWATWCSPCKKELNNIHELYDDWKNKYDLVLVAVNTDNARNTQKVKPYVDGQGWEYEIMMDVNQDFQRALNIVQIPHTFLLDQNGQVVYQHSGYVEGDEIALEEKIKALMAKK
jgi:thiol-disulfide isomerase/thioredoxin